jgi:predicted MFS family arabinose efflux permease
MDNLSMLIPLFLNGGWIVLFIGAAGMVARLATSKNPEDKSLSQVLSNITASMIASMIAWFIMEQFAIGAMWKAIAYGLVGLNSPELLTGIIKLSTKFSENPSEFISNIRSGSSVKPSSKPKPKPKPTPKPKPKPKPRLK